MSKLMVALVSLATIVVLVLAYRFIFNPQLVGVASVVNASKCPERWTYSDGLCKPNYQTSCMPFDPAKITSAVSGCNLARTCGTDWTGMCA